MNASTRCFLTLLYITALILYFQQAFFNYRIIQSFSLSIQGFIDETVCSPKYNAENAAMEIGRLDHLHPSPRCCDTYQCIGTGKPNIVLTTLRNDAYLPLLKTLYCTFTVSNPNVTFVVATVRGDLSESTLDAVHAMRIQIVFWDELKFRNKKSPRFELNWVKIRAWEMVEYGAILMIDADTVIVRDVSHLFLLPTAFAAALDQDKVAAKYNSLGRMQGGVVLLRPCPAVARHMITILEQHEHLRFTSGHAEQSFFDWYLLHKLCLPITL